MTTTVPFTVLGTAPFSLKSGDWGTIPTVDISETKNILKVFKNHGHSHLDTARSYGTSENTLGQLQVESEGFVIDTKIRSFEPGLHTPEKVRESFKQSLEALNTKKVHILYLHSPDRSTPFIDTVRTINEIFKEGGFEKFGLSNYTTEEVEQIVKICKENGWIVPTVYQGNYNAITRKNEETLFPLLRKEGISFYAYSPLAGGFFSNPKASTENGARFDSSHFLGQIYQGLYFKDSYFKALDTLNERLQDKGVSATEGALRWVYYHSQLKREYGDAVILGSRRSEQLESNLKIIEKGPLPKDVVDVFEQLWQNVQADAPNYHN